jgi:hypothetical protein
MKKWHHRPPSAIFRVSRDSAEGNRFSVATPLKGVVCDPNMRDRVLTSFETISTIVKTSRQTNCSSIATPFDGVVADPNIRQGVLTSFETITTTVKTSR